MQPIFHEPMDGLCQAACVASLFHLTLEEVAQHVSCPDRYHDPESNEFLCRNPDHWLSYDKDAGHAPGEGQGHWRCQKVDFQTELYEAWAAKRGLSFSSISINPYDETWPNPRHSAFPPGLCIAHGPADRGHNHAVVWDTRLTDAERPWGRMVHDPHPDGTGINELEGFYWFEVIDPSIAAKVRMETEERLRLNERLAAARRPDQSEAEKPND